MLFIAFSGLKAVFPLPAFAADQVRIAAIFSETGIAVDHNKPAIEGAILAVEDINENGGVMGLPIELMVIDNRSTPIGSKLAAVKASDMGVTAVIGSIWSSHSDAMATVLQKAKIPMITPGSTKTGVTRKGDYIFRICFIDSFQGPAMAGFAYDDLGARTAVVFTNINEPYSVNLASHFIKAFTGRGGQLLQSRHYKGSAVDFTGILKKGMLSRPDVYFVPGYSRDSGLLIKQAVKLGIETTFLGCDAWDGSVIFEYGGDALKGSYYSTHWHPQVTFPRSHYFKKLYRKKFGNREITSPVILTYDAVMVLADAIGRAGSLDRISIRNALAETKNFKGATGNISFDANGDPVDKEMSIIRFGRSRQFFVKSMRP